MLSISVSKRKIMIEQLGFVGIKILLALHESEEALYIREIIREAKISSSTINRALAVLSDFGLITYEYKFNRKFVRLTRAGREVAELIAKADEIIEKTKKLKEQMLDNP